MKSKTTAGLLAFFLGGIGIHKFYLNRGGLGIFYVLFCWTLIPALVAFFEGFILLFMNDHDFNMRYNPQMMPAHAAPQQIAQSVTVNVPLGADGQSVAAQLKELNELRVAGALTEEEFTAQKQKVLGA